jgi:mRNA interferase MazF
VLVLSSRDYNAKRGLMIGCPITSKVKGYPFEVPLGPGSGVAGVVLADHVKSFDFRARHAEAIGATPQATVDAVAQIVAALIGLL